MASYLRNGISRLWIIFISIVKNAKSRPIILYLDASFLVSVRFKDGKCLILQHNMKKKWYRVANGALSALLVLLGFEACTENGAEEYGSPTVDFHVVGQVTDAEGHPIEGIRVTTRGYQNFNDGTTEQAAYTDKEGRYTTKEVRSDWIDPKMKVVFEDVDGEENGGLFASDSVSAGSMAKVKVRKGDGNWYEGEYELTANAKLKKE